MALEWADDIEPVDLRWEDDDTVVGVTWSDGHESRYRLPYLRQICPCAVCRDAHSQPPIATRPAKPSFKILNEVEVQLAKGSAQVKSVEPVGNYAIAFTWSDGHDDGIYSYRMLRSMCPCPECVANLKDAEGQVQQSLVESARRESRQRR